MIKLYPHQKEGVDFILRNDGVGALYWSIGTGKTIGALEIYRRLRIKTPGLKLIVICPLSLIESAWAIDVQKFGFTYNSLRKKFRNADIYLINFESLSRSKKKQKVCLDLFKKHKFMCAIDESQKLKNNRSGITKTLLALRNMFEYKLLMSGTPAPNCLSEYWAQMRFLDDNIFHKSFYAFRNTFFHLQRGDQVMQGRIMCKATAREVFSNGWSYAITDENKEKLLNYMSPFCHRRKLTECIDMPERIEEVRYIELSAKHRAQYNMMKRHCVLELQNAVVIAQVALAKIQKLRQIVSGFLYDEHSVIQEIGENPKLKELLSILEEAGEQQIIIWCFYRWEIHVILNALKTKAKAVYGGVSENDKIKNIEDFKTGQVQYLICNPASVAHGLTLTNSHLQVFFSLSYSYELFEQAKGRIFRISQHHSCVYIYLVARDTIDETMLGVLRKKGKMQARDIVAEFLKS